MPLPTPKLDDRTFDQLRAEAEQFIGRTCPEWTDRTPHDPGMVLLEAFAYVTDLLLYRVNRLPEKAYVEFLRLLGVKLVPPAAARVDLRFAVSGSPAATPIRIPRGTRVAGNRPGASGAPATFTTAEDATIAAGARETTALAFHCDVVEGELLGTGTGLPGQALTVKRPPIVAPTGDALDLVVGVEDPSLVSEPGVERLKLGDKVYRVWREVGRLADAEESVRYVYVADRHAGTISFAPAVSLVDSKGALTAPRAHLEVPALGREVRAWYRRGGGPEGNVAAGELVTLKEPLRGAPPLTVDNPEPAMGGRPAESVANALLRGPEEVHSLRRAVTATDFEILARRAGGVARARAVTQAELWAHGRPGTVEILLVPELPRDVRGPTDAGVTAAALRAHHGEATRAAIQADLDARRPLGTQCAVKWARYKTVTVKATVRAHRAADRGGLRERVLARLHRYLDPLPSPESGSGGWPFGEPLPKGTVYHLIQSEPGVARVDSLSFLLEEVPSAATALVADPFQPSTWYAAAAGALYRTMTDADGWETVGAFDGERIEAVASHPGRPGLLAVATREGDDASSPSRIRRSTDCGESWLPWDRRLPRATDLAWITRGGAPVLLIATTQGLYELALEAEAQPLPVTVAAADPNLSLYAIATATDARGTWIAAVAAQDRKGVYLSEEGARAGSFRPHGLEHEDVRRLELQQEGVRTRLWAGLFAASPDDPGRGVWMRELTGGGDWQQLDQGWDGGSCFALAFDGTLVYAATHHGGVLSMDVSKEGAQWVRPAIDSGLPTRQRDKIFQEVRAVAARGGKVLVGGAQGVHRRRADGRYESCSGKEVSPELLPVPETWLFCSGEHEIEVVGT